MAQQQTRPTTSIAAGNSNPIAKPAPLPATAPRAQSDETTGSTDPTLESQVEKPSAGDKTTETDPGGNGGNGSGGGPPSGPLIGISDATVGTFASAALGQVVSMLGEDTRTYLQGMEQIYTAAAGKALAMIAKGEPDQAIGIALLAQIKASQQDTTTFATDIATVAKQFVSIKGG